MSSAQSQQVIEHSMELESLPITVDDTPSLTVSQIRSRIMRSEGVGVAVIDYLQLMSGRAENRQQVISAISRGLKGIAREFNIPIIALSQLSRKVEERKPPRPQLSDLRESGAIEQDADMVLLVYRPIYYGITTFNGKKGGESTHGKAEILIAKQRNGPTGILKLAFLDQYARFETLAESTQEEQQTELQYYQK